MVVSILHRITGAGLSAFGLVAFVWWLVAASSGAEAYGNFLTHARSWYGVTLGIGLSWAFFQHMLSGLRHFVLDIGAGYALTVNKFWSVVILMGSVFLTSLFWFLIVRLSG